MRTFAQRHPMAAFLVLAYLSAAVIFALPLLSNAGTRRDRSRAAGRRAVRPAVRPRIGGGGVRHHVARRWARRRPRPAEARLQIQGPPGLVCRDLPSARHGDRNRGRLRRHRSDHRAGEQPRRAPRHRRGRGPRRLPARQLVGGGGLDGVCPPSAPAAHGADRRERRHHLAAGDRPPAARLRRRRCHRRPRSGGSGPVLPGRALHPADLGPAGDHVDLQRQRPQRPDRRPVPRRPRSGDRQRVHPGAGAERRSDLGLRRIRCARGSGSRSPPVAGWALRRRTRPSMPSTQAAAAA